VAAFRRIPNRVREEISNDLAEPDVVRLNDQIVVKPAYG
jgi:hypothetical protein